MSDPQKPAIDDPVWPQTQDQLTDDAGSNISSLQAAFTRLLEEEGIPVDTGPNELLNTLYLPMASWLAARQQNSPLVVGINGAQGSGKSTLTKILSMLLSQGFDKNVVSISIDDLYLTRAERQQLAEDIHPLFLTRGVPGTHDVELGKSILMQLHS